MTAKDSSIGYLLLFAQLAAFLTMGAIGRGAADVISWQSIVSARTVFGAVAVIAYSLATRVPLPWPTSPGLWPRSILGAVGVQFTFYALAGLPLATSIAVFHIFPVWTAIFAWFFLGNRLSRSQILAIVITICGVPLIHRPSSAGPAGALFCGILASIFQAIAILIVHRLHRVHPVQIVVHSSTTAAIASLAMLFLTDKSGSWETIMVNPRLLTILLAIGILGAVGQILLTQSAKRLPPVIVSTAGLLEVPAAMIISGFTRPEPFSFTELCGATMICLGAGSLVLNSLPSLPARIAVRVQRRTEVEELSMQDVR